MGLKLDNGLRSALAAMDNRTDAALKIFAEQAAKKLENAAKENAPWTDRTGAARQRLTGTQSKIPKGRQLQLSHGVDYGAFLELAREKQYAIIDPTIKQTGQNDIMPSFKGFIEKLR